MARPENVLSLYIYMIIRVCMSVRTYKQSHTRIPCYNPMKQVLWANSNRTVVCAVLHMSTVDGRDGDRCKGRLSFPPLMEGKVRIREELRGGAKALVSRLYQDQPPRHHFLGKGSGNGLTPEGACCASLATTKQGALVWFDMETHSSGSCGGSRWWKFENN